MGECFVCGKKLVGGLDTFGPLFSGIGGFDLGLERAGIERIHRSYECRIEEVGGE